MVTKQELEQRLNDMADRMDDATAASDYIFDQANTPEEMEVLEDVVNQIIFHMEASVKAVERAAEKLKALNP